MRNYYVLALTCALAIFNRVDANPNIPGLHQSLNKARRNVGRFHLGQHLKHPTNREKRRGLTVSERYRTNPHLIRQRDTRAAPPDPDWATEDVPVLDAYPNPPNPNGYPPGKFPVNTAATQDAMPFGDGPGVMPGLPQGNPEFWAGNAFATNMWEVVACPVADVEGFLSNPLRCYFGNLNEDGSGSNSSPYEFFADIFKDTNAISQAVVSVIVDAAVDIIVGILPVDMFSDVFDALCPILELIGDVLSFLGGGGDYEEDGCFTDDAGIFGSLLNVVSFGGACAIEDAIDRKLVENTGDDLNLQICTDTAPGVSDSNPSGYGHCRNGDDTENDYFRCFRPFAVSQPESPGVCVQTLVIDRVATGQLTLTIPYLMQVFQLIQQASNDKILDAAVDILTTQITEETAAIDGTLSGIDNKLGGIDNKLDTILSQTGTRRRLGQEDTHENRANTADNSKGPHSSQTKKDHAFEEAIDSFLNKQSPNKNAAETGSSGSIADVMTDRLLHYAKGPRMGDARNFIRDEVQTLLQDPNVAEQLVDGMRKEMAASNTDSLVKEMSTRMLSMARNKKTGKIDSRRLKAIQEDLKQLQDKGETEATTLDDAQMPRFLSFTEDDEDSCAGDGAEDLRNLLSKFIRVPVCNLIEGVGLTIELADQTSIANKIFEFTNFWDDDGPFSSLLEGLVDIFQFVAALFIFGPDDNGQTGVDDFDTTNTDYQALITRLPSNGRVLPIRQTASGDVFMASGCDSNFEGELQFYKQIEDVIVKTLKALSEALGQWLNAPIELLKWLLEMLFKMFSHMNDVCGYLDGFVQLALVEGTFENSRYILQEVACRPVANLARGSGCDGVDSDCNFETDDCSEDLFPPEIDATLAASECGGGGVWFQSEDDAKACVLSKTTAVDDCGPVATSVAVVAGSGTCTPTVTFSAVDTRCGRSSAASVSVQVDSTPPTVTCALSPPSPLTGNGGDKVKDAGFSYSVSDNCSPNEDINISIEVLSNEVAGGPSAFVSAPDAASNQVTMFLENNYCSNAAGSCSIEWGGRANQKSREYVARVKATDAAGNTGTCEASVFVATDASQGSPLYSLKTVTI